MQVTDLTANLPGPGPQPVRTVTVRVSLAPGPLTQAGGTGGRLLTVTRTWTVTGTGALRNLNLSPQSLSHRDGVQVRTARGGQTALVRAVPTHEG
jgi:hypothetical protein